MTTNEELARELSHLYLTHTARLANEVITKTLDEAEQRGRDNSFQTLMITSHRQEVIEDCIAALRDDDERGVLNDIPRDNCRAIVILRKLLPGKPEGETCKHEWILGTTAFPSLLKCTKCGKEMQAREASRDQR